MKETKQAIGSAETRAAMHEVMAAFEAFKAANDERLEEIEAKRADVLLEEKVARIDADSFRGPVAIGVQDRPLRQRRSSSPPVRRCTSRGAQRAQGGLGRLPEVRAAGGPGGQGSLRRRLGRLYRPARDRARDRLALTHASPMREICTVQTIGAAMYQKPVATVGVTAGWAAETAARHRDRRGDADVLLQFPAADLYASPAATQALARRQPSSTSTTGWPPSARTPSPRRRPRRL